MVTASVTPDGTGGLMEWFRDPERFRARLMENGNSVAKLATESGIPRTTLNDWKRKHGILTGGRVTEVASVEADLVKQNETLRLENQRLRKHATKTAAGDVATERVLERIDSAV